MSEELRQQRAGVERLILTVSLCGSLLTGTFLIGWGIGLDDFYDPYYFLNVGSRDWTVVISVAILLVALMIVVKIAFDFGVTGWRALVAVVGCLVMFPLSIAIAGGVFLIIDPPYVSPV